jgi:integrase
MVAGDIVERGLGRYPELTLKVARDKAVEWARVIRSGGDPRRTASPVLPQVTTFKSAAEDFIRAKEAGWKSEVHRAQWKQTLSDYAYPSIGDIDVRLVGIDHIEALILPIWLKKNPTAQNVLSRIAMVLDWAVAKKLRETDNPARLQGPLKHLLPETRHISVKHHNALPYRDVPALMARLKTLSSTSARALEFTILTASRTSETLHATRDEFFDNEWRIPGERMKAGAAHRVPLSSQAAALIEALPIHASEPGIIFKGHSGRFLSNMAMLQCVRGIQPGLTVHGFRSSFRDWAAEQTDFDHAIVEAALAHTVADAVVRAYRRTTFLDKRRELMQLWADYCDGS